MQFVLLQSIGKVYANMSALDTNAKVRINIDIRKFPAPNAGTALRPRPVPHDLVAICIFAGKIVPLHQIQCSMPTNEDIMIAYDHVTHYYGKRLIYKDLSFSVPRGRILGLLGKNGTGKTTTINILSGFIRPAAGSCRLLGYDTRTMPAAVRQRIGLLLEGHVQYPFMTIEQIERFYAPFYPHWNKEAYYELMRLLQVKDYQRLQQMSNGQRSQVALGLLMAQDPELLILDDFSLGLDPGYRRLFVEYLRDFCKAKDKTVFLTSHIIQDLERLVDDCIIMDYGRILRQCPVSELITPASTLEDTFIELTGKY